MWLASCGGPPEVREEPRVLLFEDMGQTFGSDTHPIPTDEHLYHGDVARWVAIRYGKYKYIRTLLAGEMEEIYDVEADPQELSNLALRPEHRALLADLRSIGKRFEHARTIAACIRRSYGDTCGRQGSRTDSSPYRAPNRSRWNQSSTAQKSSCG